MTQPTIAIIIPTYNGLEHLKPCLDSLAALAYPADRL
jgi:GT2 family glycosyltransferase